MLGDDPVEPGPEFEVWNHLESGWQQAYDDMARQDPPFPMALYEALAEAVVDLNTSLLLGPADTPASGGLAKLLPDITPAEYHNIVAKVSAKYTTLDQWTKHAIELRVAARGIARAQVALTRFYTLPVEVLASPVPDKVRPYVTELVHTYLFGFDAAAIALGRSTFEQFAKTVLVARGVFTEPQMRREQPTAGTVLQKLKQAGLLSSHAFASASRLVERGDTLLHRGVQDEKVLATSALDSIRELVEVARELAGNM